MTCLKLMSRQWIVDENRRIIMGEGRRQILENIQRTGSINQAAKVMKMSYKAVWSKIKATETSLNRSIVHADRRAGSRLTAEGEELLSKYVLLKKRCLESDNRIFERIFGQGSTLPGGPLENAETPPDRNHRRSVRSRQNNTAGRADRRIDPLRPARRNHQT